MLKLCTILKLQFSSNNYKTACFAAAIVHADHDYNASHLSGANCRAGSLFQYWMDQI